MIGGRTLLAVVVIASTRVPEVRAPITDGPPATRPAAKDRAASTTQPILAVSQILNRRIDQIQWEEKPFGEVIEWLEGLGPINVVVVWRALDTESVTRDTPVTLRMKEATVAVVLKEALSQLSEDGSVRYRAAGSTLTLSTREDFNRVLYVRLYDVSDLVHPTPDFHGPGLGPLGGGLDGMGAGGGSGLGTGAARGGGFGGGSTSSGIDGASTGATIEERLEQLADRIKKTIEPDSWEDKGGRGTIRVFQRRLVVRNTVEVHEKIGGPMAEDGL